MNELEAAIKRATYGRTFTGRRMIEAAAALVDDPPAPAVIYPKIMDIKRAVADYFSVEMVDLDGGHQNKRMAYIRHVAMYLCRRMTLHSYPEIGRRMGGRDHTTVMKAYDKMCAKIERGDQPLTSEIADLKSIIGAKLNGQETKTKGA